jgi:predicted oxidoreductase
LDNGLLINNKLIFFWLEVIQVFNPSAEEHGLQIIPGFSGARFFNGDNVGQVVFL